MVVPEDGYVGFYLEKYQETIPKTENEIEAKVQDKDYYLDLKDIKSRTWEQNQ